MTSSTASVPVPPAPVGGSEREPPPQPLKRRAAASAYLRERWGVERAPGTLAKLAVVGGGPRFRKAGRIPLYAPTDLDAWASELLGEAVTSTSELRGEGPSGRRSEPVAQTRRGKIGR
jgi:hypothetical protein